MFQKIIMVGHCGQEPSMRYTPNGNAVTDFSVAVSNRYKKDDEWKEETTWFRVTVWGKQAETVNEYLKKGSKVLVEGRLVGDESTGSPRVFQRKDGTWGASFELRAETVRFLDKKNESATSEPSGTTEEPF